MAEPSVLDCTHVVLTPEYVEFDFVLAGLYSRFLAWLLDTLITALGAGIVITVLTVAFAAFPGFASALAFVVWFLIDWGYGIVLESAWSGQTVGKRALGIRAVQESGVRIGFYHAALRNLVRPLDRLPITYLVGGTSAFLSQSHQRLGDFLAGTIVVRDRRLAIPSSITRSDEKEVPDARFLANVDRLTRAEQELILSAAMRREELGLSARLNLFAALSERLQKDLGFFKPEHHSDEKLVLLTASALAKKRTQRRAQKYAAKVAKAPPPS
ncbi:MAG: RDD family protein [Myxococcaceae bacterium]